MEKDEQSVFIQKEFGFREIRAEGSNILLNEKPIYLRGILHWGYYDDEIIPNPSKEVIADEIQKIKAYDFNMIKHCLYIPREEYLEMADREGMLLWIELPLWLPDVTPELSQRIRREFPAILKQLAGHPSVVMISLGCELNDKVSSEILEEMYFFAKAHSDALVRDNSGSGECYDGLAVDYADFFDYHFYGDLQNMEPLMENFTPSWRSYRPWIFGEFCDSDTMRDLNEVREKKGKKTLTWEVDDASKNPISILKPDFYMGKHDERMVKSGMRKDFAEIKQLSYDHTMVHRKVTLEQTRSFPEIMGYNITSIRDVPIATSGMFDDMMEPKFPIEEVRKINGDVALVPAWDLTRIWINADRVMNRERYNFFSGDMYRLHILLSNYEDKEITNPVLEWSIYDRGDAIKVDRISINKATFVAGVQEVGYIVAKLPDTAKLLSLELRVKMICDEFEVENSWPIFVYPRLETKHVRIGLYDPVNVWATIDKIYENVVEISDEDEIAGVDVVLASVLTQNIKKYLKQGGKVVYIQRGKGSVPVTPVAFWREGIIRKFAHPVLDEVEKVHWMDDLRYFSLGTDTAINSEMLANLGYENIKPMLRRYDCRTWEATDYLLEASYGKGTIFMTTLRFEGNMGKQPMFLENNVYARWMLEKMIL